MFDRATAGDYYREAMAQSIVTLNHAVGGLTRTSKMPWLSYSLSPKHCKTGSALRKVPGSVCSKCYACKGMYVFPVAKAAQKKRRQILLSNPEFWAGTIAALIEKKARYITDDRRYFRWHDSGDIQNDDHYKAIIWIAEIVQSVWFYLPTKEARCVPTLTGQQRWRIPHNLTVRKSMRMIGSGPVDDKLCTTVGWDGQFQCPAYSTADHKCGECRACWCQGFANINYNQH